MESRNIKAFFNSVVDRVGEEAEAVFTIVKKGDSVTVHMGGISEFMIDPNAVAIAATMRHVLETEMRTADRIGQKRRSEGGIKIDTERMEVVDSKEEKKTGNNAPTNDAEFSKAVDSIIGEFFKTIDRIAAAHAEGKD